LAIPEPNISNMLRRVDNKGAKHVHNEYLTLGLTFNNYEYSHDGLGYKVINSATSNANYITISEKIASCTCSTFLQYQLPCRQLLFVMKSVVDLTPYIAQRWLKNCLVSKSSEYSESINTQYETTIEANIWSQMGSSILEKNNLKIQTPNEKYNALKVVFDQISNLLCLSGQKDFNDNLAFFVKHLDGLRTNTVAHKPPRIPRPHHRVQIAQSTITTTNIPSTSRRSASPNEMQQAAYDYEREQLLEQEQNQNQDYIDHRMVHDEEARDGDMDNHKNNLNTEFRVKKVVRRRGRSKGAAAPFGFFATRGGVSGNPKSVKLRSQSANSNAATSKPKTGPGSRGGRGGYSKKIKPSEELILSSNNSSQNSESSPSPPRKPSRKQTRNRIVSE
jgi:hypothetical protein